MLIDAALIDSHFENGSFRNCYILRITLGFSNFNNAEFRDSTLTRVDCRNCRFEHARFDNVLFIENYFNGANFA